MFIFSLYYTTAYCLIDMFLFFHLSQLSPSVSTFIHSVPFQPATDNRSNFGSDKAFHTFKKQRYSTLMFFCSFEQLPT